MISPDKSYGVKSFIFKMLNLDKHDPKLRESFVENLAYEGFKLSESLGLKSIPDSIADEISKLVIRIEKLELKKNSESTEKKEPEAAELIKIKDTKSKSSKQDEAHLETRNTPLQAFLADILVEKSAIIFNISEVFVDIYDLFYKNSFYQAVYFTDVLYEAKGVLVMLKVIAEKLIHSYNLYIIPERLVLKDAESKSIKVLLCENILKMLHAITNRRELCNFRFS